MRRRCLLVDTVRVSGFTDMEAVLLRCPKFFAKENLVTVFPEAERCAQHLQSASAPSAPPHYYLLYTFQASDFVEEERIACSETGESQALTSEDDDAPTGTTSATPSPVYSPAKTTEDDFSDLIHYSPTSVEWKDRSRDRFFSFMAAVRARVEARLGCTDEPSPRFFMDWPDPATGLPITSERGASIFCDADAMQQFFAFNSVLIAGPGGGCRMIEHPRLGLNVYPAAGVLVLPQDAEAMLCETIRSFEA
ncbi:hypothetical protein NESM_000171100 [Novymonas esmeraldas]|uniref:Uncharacterized protein n=1 Tax=Novymonas esmeraldas TaxID=1808958 RepID=A0AAW0F4H4_9TRYP